MDTADRFSETFPTFTRVDRDEDGFTEPLYSAAGPQCQNCNQTVERITWVEGFDYWGCDDCMEEAMRVTASEEPTTEGLFARLKGLLAAHNTERKVA